MFKGVALVHLCNYNGFNESGNTNGEIEMNAATKIEFRKSQLESLIEKARGMIDMGINELGMDQSDELIQDELKAIESAQNELKQIREALADQGVFMV